MSVSTASIPQSRPGYDMAVVDDIVDRFNATVAHAPAAWDPYSVDEDELIALAELTAASVLSAARARAERLISSAEVVAASIRDKPVEVLLRRSVDGHSIAPAELTASELAAIPEL